MPSAIAAITSEKNTPNTRATCSEGDRALQRGDRERVDDERGSAAHHLHDERDHGTVDHDQQRRRHPVSGHGDELIGERA